MHSHNGHAPLTELRFDWTSQEIEAIYNLPLP